MVACGAFPEGNIDAISGSTKFSGGGNPAYLGELFNAAIPGTRDDA
jgi:hypothetical protein